MSVNYLEKTQILDFDDTHHPIVNSRAKLAEALDDYNKIGVCLHFC